MIYLIDDKKTRQKDFGWFEEKFTQYASQLNPLYSIDDVAKIGENLYNNGNIILYHESFLDFTDDKDKAVKQRNKLLEKAELDTGLFVAFFSGSQSTRYLKGNMAELPVAILYQNLEILIQQNNKGSGNLKYLLFGVNPEIEEELNEKLTQVNREIEESSVEISGTSLFIRPASRYIQNAIKGATEEKIFNDNSDEKLSEKISEWLIETEYDNIFLPLCFGQTLSDYSGLRLATHIRCTPTKNQIKRIFIYGFVGLDYLLEHEYFNILKTKNIQLVSYSKKAFGNAANTYFDSFKPEELSKEIKKLKLDPPLNYADSHSIANEWAIHRWAKTIGCDETEGLERVFENVKFNLYFKYLKTIHPVKEKQIISSKKLEINYEGNPRILLIDDEASKGWKEFYSSLLSNSSKKIEFEDSGIDFKEIKSSAIIISKVESKVNQFKPDIVFLDLRLLDSDFDKETSPKELTGLKVLEKIKGINKGIQIIITTASNKAWNFNLAKQKGAYDFIIKDGSEEPEISITKLTHTIENACKRSLYLKPIYEKMTNSLNAWNSYYIPKRINISDPMHDTLWHVNLKLQVIDFVKNAFDTINNDAIVERFTISTLLLYRVIEMINEFYIIESGDYRNNTNQCHFDQDNLKVPKIGYNRKIYSVSTNVPNGSNFSTKEKSYAIYHKINSNTDKTLFSKIHQLTEYRNKVTIHPNKRFKEESLEYIFDSDFRRFNSLLNEYFSAILDYVSSFK